MDRRQRKTRYAIFDAFIFLLKEKNFEKITVGEIIERADIGRATFYAHFETKDYLLKELCNELFCHVFDSLKGEKNHRHIFDCTAEGSVYLHIFEHIYKNDNRLLDLLSCPNNGLFLGYFKNGLISLIKNQRTSTVSSDSLPEELVLNHIASTFVETVRWWVSSKMKEPPEKINEYFTTLIKNI